MGLKGTHWWIALVGLSVCVQPAAAEQDEPEPGYELKVDRAVTVTTGTAGTVSLTIAPRPGFTIDRDGPLRVRVAVTPGEGLVLPRKEYRRKDAADERADAPRFDLKFRAERAGDYRVSIDARFWVCRRYTCRAVSETREVGVRVADPAPPPAADAGPPSPTDS